MRWDRNPTNSATPARAAIVPPRESVKKIPTATTGSTAVAAIWLKPPIPLTTNAGMNRFAWDLRYQDGPLVLPGTYQVRLTVGGKTYTQPLVVKMDPRSTATPEDLQKQFDLSMQCMKGIAQARSAGLTQVVGRLTIAMQVAQSADRVPPATAYEVCGAGASPLPKL